MRDITPECFSSGNGAWVMNLDSQEPVLHVQLLPGVFGEFIRKREENSEIKKGKRIGVYVLSSLLQVDRAPASAVQAQGVWWTLLAGLSASESISRARLALGWTGESTSQSSGETRHEA